MHIEVEKGIALHKQSKHEKAEECYLKALGDDFDDPEALCLLGILYGQQKQTAIAAQFFRRAVQIKTNYFEAWNNLGNCYKSFHKDIDAKICFEKALKYSSDRTTREIADVWSNIGTIYINAGASSKAEEYFRKALKVDDTQPDAHWNLALACLEQGKYKEGFSETTWGFKTKTRLWREYGENIKYWDGTHGKNIIVWGEQGIGDEILFSSMLPDLIKVSNKVIFDCHPNLASLFKESFPNIKIYGTRKDNLINWPASNTDMNAKISIGDLGKFFRNNLSDFPKHSGYLKANKERVEHYKRKLAKIGNRPKIGISWTGGYAKTRKDYRSIPLEQWEPILRQDADFISLQYTPEAYKEVSEVEDKFDTRIYHWPSAVTEGVRGPYIETAALVDALDLVVTINTSLHHLTGALGKECWTLTPQAKAWRYYSPDKDGHSIPWYPSVYQYQQEKLMDWQPIIKEVAEDLNVFISEKRRNRDYQPCDTINREVSVV